MATVTIHEAKTNLSKLIRDALGGKDVVIAKGKKPLVRIVPLPEARPARRLDGAAGSVRMSEDFDAPLQDFEEYMR